MDRQFELIVAIVNRGFSDLVMDAARKAGASVGTILHGRGTGVHEAAQFFGVAIQPEKELVLILTRASERRAIMAAIAEGAHLDRQGRGLTFSLPVDEVAGIVHLLDDAGKDAVATPRS